MIKILSVDSVQLNTSISKLKGNMILKVCGNMYGFVPNDNRAVNYRNRQNNIAKVPHFQTAITLQFRRGTLSFKVRMERIGFR
jgi:hypothetical protein